jgi:TPR repeat protein
MQWLDKAIAAKDFSAYLVKGMYQENVKKDPKAALAEYERGKDAGQVGSMLRVAEFHMTGKGTEKDVPRGLQILETAAEAGSPQAHLLLAATILNEKEPDILKGYAHLVSAANGGLPTAQNELGLFYLSNKMGASDLSAALSWFGRAAQSNFAPAQNNLGALHERGAGVPQSFENAGKLYSLAAQQGHAEAMLALARLHAAGAGIEMNRQRAWALAKLAEERGGKNAPTIIAEIEKQLTAEQLATAKKELENLKSGKPAE